MKIGDYVTWLYVPRGGYGYTCPVDGIVVKICKSKIKIGVRKSDGEYKEIFVSPENLRLKPSEM